MNGNAYLDPEEVDTHDIANMGIKSLIDGDDIFINSTKSDFVAVEDDNSIGDFESTSSRFTLNKTPNFFEFDKYTFRNFFTKESSDTNQV